LPSGIIIKGIGGFYYVRKDDEIYECKARGIFRKDEITPLPGDLVSFTVIDEDHKKGTIDKIHERQSQLIRPAVANINQVIVVISIKSPAPDLLLLDKLLVMAEHQNIDAIVCINKIDLASDEEYSEICEAYSKAGYEVILSSSKTGDGLDNLKKSLNGRISVLAGQSGVGKSTILNKIIDSQVMKTGNISDKIERGRHTTRHAELVKVETDGYLVDTPGFSSLGIANITYDKLALYYREFQNYMDRCRFTHCSHISEPQCAIKEAVNEGLIDKGRYMRYISLYSTLKQQKQY